MAEEFPLPSSSYKELIKIIRAYGRIGTEASLGDVSKLAVMGETSVSGNNKFLIALGIIVPVCNYLMNRFWVFLRPRGVSSRSLGIITPE